MHGEKWCKIRFVDYINVVQAKIRSISFILTISFPFSAFRSPVVIAVVVHGPLAVEEQAVFAGLHRQRPIRAEEELVAELWVRVRLRYVKCQVRM